MSFNNKTFVVTGGNSGIGYDTAKFLADEGAKVYITGRNPTAVAEAAAVIGKKVIGVVADAASISDSVKLADTIAANGDKLDGAFINAGIGAFVPFELADEAHFDVLFNTNVKGAYFTIQKLLPVLKDGSSIVLNGSGVIHIGLPATSVYSATKGALNSFAKTLSRDLLPRKIRVNTVNPGPVETPILGKLGLPTDVAAGMKNKFATDIPIGRMGVPAEITGYVAFLLSDKSTFVLGTELTIDGGMTQL